MKKIALISLFIIFFAKTAYADLLKWLVVRAECFPELNSFEIIYSQGLPISFEELGKINDAPNDISVRDDVVAFWENDTRSEEEIGMEKYVSCQLKDGLYNIELQALIYKCFYEAVSKVEIKAKDSWWLVNHPGGCYFIRSGFTLVRFDDTTKRVYTNKYDEDPPDDYSNLQDPVYPTLDPVQYIMEDRTHDELYLTQIDKSYDKKVITPDDGKVFVVRCVPELKAVEIRLQAYRADETKQTILEKGKELAEKDVYAFESEKAPDVYKKQCDISGVKYEITLDKTPALTIKKDEKIIANHIRLYDKEKNRVINRLQYSNFYTPYVEWWQDGDDEISFKRMWGDDDCTDTEDCIYHATPDNHDSLVTFW